MAANLYRDIVQTRLRLVGIKKTAAGADSSGGLPSSEIRLTTAWITWLQKR